MTKKEREKIHLDRIRASDDSKKVLNQKIRAIRNMMEVHEDKILESDSWRATYRLPELFGISERKKADLMEHLPEVVVDAEFMDQYNLAVASTEALKHFQFLSNARDIKMQVISSAVDYGTGIKYDGIANVERMITPVGDKPELFLKKAKKRTKTTIYYGLAPSSIDLRDAFPDPSATMDFDPSGQKGMRWFYKRTIVTEEGFKESFVNKLWPDGTPVFDTADIKPVNWESVEDFGVEGAERSETKHESEEKAANAEGRRYMVVFEGWTLDDEHVFLANGKLMYEGANPFAHKSLPVTFYYNYKRDDSIFGISEAEVNAPFILVKEVLINLMIDNAKLSQQPVIAVSGDAQFDPDENELEPGALFTIAGLNGGKVGDAIQPLTFGSSVEPAMAVKQIIEDMQIQVTGDDSRALMVQPQELATQTLSKREALKKRIRKNVMENTIHSERNSVMQQFSNICQYLARPYKDISGKWKHHVVYVDDFKVSQRNAKELPIFTPVNGYQGVFKLNENILKPEYVRFRVIERVEDAVKKEQELQALQWWMQTIFSLAQTSPNLVQNTDLEMLAKQAGARFTGLDVESIFNSATRLVDGMDEIDYFLQQIALGIQPIIPRDGNNLARFNRLRKYERTKEYALLNENAKTIYKKTIVDLAKAVREEKALPYADYTRLRMLGAAGKTSQPSAVPGRAQPGGAALQQPAGSAPSPEGGAQPA